MFDMFAEKGGLGIFGNVPEMVKAAEEKEKAENKERHTKKEPAEEKYVFPAGILFDSIASITIEETGSYQKNEVMQKITEMTGCKVFADNPREFEIKKVNENYLVRPRQINKVAKSQTGKKLLLEKEQELENFLTPSDEKEISCEDVIQYVKKSYGIDVELFLIGDTYIPIPYEKERSASRSLSFPIKVTALTLVGESVEISKEDFISYAQDGSKEENGRESGKNNSAAAETVDLSSPILSKLLCTLLPEYANDMQYVLIKDKEQQLLVVRHKAENTQKKADIKKNDMYPTDATIGLVFTQIKLNPMMFDGASEVTAKEIIRILGKQYPEYSQERTILEYDKKKKLIIPTLKSGKRGAYQGYVLEETEDYRLEETGLMSICAKKAPFYQCCYAGSVELHVPKIPFAILQKAVQFFWDVYVLYRSEAIVQIYYSLEKKEYEIFIPFQKVEGGSLDFEHDNEMEHDSRQILVMELHSHAGFCAFWSGTDNAEELSHQLYGVVGDLPHFRYDKEHIIVRAGTGGYHVQMPIEQVFEFPKTVAEFHKGMEKVTYKNFAGKE